MIKVVAMDELEKARIAKRAYIRLLASDVQGLASKLSCGGFGEQDARELIRVVMLYNELLEDATNRIDELDGELEDMGNE